MRDLGDEQLGQILNLAKMRLEAVRRSDVGSNADPASALDKHACVACVPLAGADEGNDGSR